MGDSLKKLQNATNDAVALVYPQPLILMPDFYNHLKAKGVDLSGCVKQQMLPKINSN